MARSENSFVRPEIALKIENGVMPPVIREGVYHANAATGLTLSSSRVTADMFYRAKQSGLTGYLGLDPNYLILARMHEKEITPFPDGLRYGDEGMSAEMHFFNACLGGDSYPLGAMTMLRFAGKAKDSYDFLKHDPLSARLKKMTLGMILPPEEHVYVLGWMDVVKFNLNSRKMLPPTYDHVMNSLVSHVQFLNQVDPNSRVMLMPMGPIREDVGRANFARHFCANPILTEANSSAFPELGEVEKSAQISVNTAKKLGMNIMDNTYFGSGLGPVYSGTPGDMLGRMHDRKIHGGRG